ncbi:MAG TPA: hypothetical protein ENI26_08170 [Methylophaga aminisulfidivorans]|uniref:Uncharacterized protein n=2 Tax=root TaxID=1 RepID=A0A7C2A7G4_9GAMM|nr:hypothetical protein [Methylophaga sp.]HEC74332.1 hypothetical protein [Methylophaga aminisulfidivorans]
MNDADYLDGFLDKDDLEENSNESLPVWVSKSNSSFKAYEAINELNGIKKQYIRRHGLKSQYTKKSNYQISKASVARIVGTTPQAIFNSVDYAGALSRYREEINEKLEQAKLQKIAKNNSGLRGERKEELVKGLQEAKNKNEDLLVETVDKVYERTINSLSLDVKRKLKLIS